MEEDSELGPKVQGLFGEFTGCRGSWIPYGSFQELDVLCRGP